MRIGPALKLEIEHTFEMVPARHHGHELYFRCPEPGCSDKTGHRSVNLSNGKTSCFICHKDGDFFRWARRLGHNFSPSGEDSGPLVRELVRPEPIRPALLLPGVVSVQLPRGFTLLAEDPTSVYVKYITRMAKRKHLTQEDFIEAGVGFTKDDPRWEAYALFPVVEHQTVVYYQGRLYSEDGEASTKRFPSRQDVPHGSKFWIYNIDELYTTKAKIALVVESVLNVLSLKWKLRELRLEDQVVPVCVFKHQISREQAAKLARITSLEEVCLLWDRDATGRAWEGARYLASRFKVSIAAMPERPGAPTFDANDDVEAAVQAFHEREVYSPLGAVRQVLAGVRLPDWSKEVIDPSSSKGA